MRAGAGCEAPRVAQELGIANFNVMQAEARGEALRVAQELGITKSLSHEMLIYQKIPQKVYVVPPLVLPQPPSCCDMLCYVISQKLYITKLLVWVRGAKPRVYHKSFISQSF